MNQEALWHPSLQQVQPPMSPEARQARQQRIQEARRVPEALSRSHPEALLALEAQVDRHRSHRWFR